jgi:hypothetical protein
MLCSEAQLIFHLLDKSLAADRDRLRPAIVSSALSRSILFRTIHDAPFEIVTTMGDVPDKAGHEMTIGARDRFSDLDRAFRYQKAASKSLHQAYVRDLDQEIGYVSPTRILVLNFEFLPGQI